MTQKEAASDIAKSIFLLAAFLFLNPLCSDSETLTGEDKEDVLCSAQCRPKCLKQGSSHTEYSLINSGRESEKTTKARLV